jgi:tRNA(Ile)-lysidine synthase
MILKVKKTIQKYNLLKKGDRVVVALSGGPDSTALLAILSAIAKEMNLTLIVAHFNHGLRGRESDADERFSHKLAATMGWVFCSAKMDRKHHGKGVSPEEYFRRERYGFLSEIARDHGAQKIALGHNLNDQAETVLLHFLRGSGLEGLRGIQPKRDEKIIRPLLEVSREEIIAYLKTSAIKYRQDASNKNIRYLRNQIRAELIPYLRNKYNPNIEASLSQMAELLRNEDEFIKDQVARSLRKVFIQKDANHVALKLNVINKLPPAIRWRLFKTVLEEFSPDKNGISYRHVKSLDGMARNSESGKKIILPMKIEARKEYQSLILEKRKNPGKKLTYEYVLSAPGSIFIKELNVAVIAKRIRKNKIDFTSQNTIYMDWDRIQQPLIVRNRRAGDWFYPLGMIGRQKIKKFFIDRKISRGSRDEMMLLVDDLSVIGVGKTHLDERVKITANTKKVLAIEIIDSKTD